MVTINPGVELTEPAASPDDWQICLAALTTPEEASRLAGQGSLESMHCSAT